VPWRSSRCAFSFGPRFCRASNRLVSLSSARTNSEPPKGRPGLVIDCRFKQAVPAAHERNGAYCVVGLPSGHRAFINTACTRHPFAETMPKVLPRRLSESKPAGWANHLLVMMKKRALPGYQRNLLPLSTRPKNRTTVGVSIHLSGPSCHDGPAWPCTGALCPCICRQPPGKHQRLSK
jgi:hypothetical protein